MWVTQKISKVENECKFPFICNKKIKIIFPISFSDGITSLLSNWSLFFSFFRGFTFTYLYLISFLFQPEKSIPILNLSLFCTHGLYAVESYTYEKASFRRQFRRYSISMVRLDMRVHFSRRFVWGAVGSLYPRFQGCM